MRLNLHARIEIAAVAMLLLGSCGDSAYRQYTEGDNNRLDSADMIARNAAFRLSNLEARVDDLEQRVNRMGR